MIKYKIKKGYNIIMMKNMEYYPWSKEVFTECLKLHDEDCIPTLDLELTAKCTKASCIYCDSRPAVGVKNPNELSYEETEKIFKEAKDRDLKWVYTCGLGEPLEDMKFKRLIELLYRLDVKISLFSNGLLIDKKKAKWLYEHDVCIILKLDTFNETNFDRILGIKGTAKKIYNALDYLLDAGYGKDGRNYTNLAFSIVPTQLSYDNIEDVIVFAKENKIFPSIGELEQAGRSLKKSHYSKLALTEEQTKKLKGTVDKLLWVNYKRPICPTIITGVHIDHIGDCVVDRITGLNCKWFLLREPDPLIIGNIKQDSLLDLYTKVREYRRRCFEENKEEIEEYKKIDYVFGGCGGNPKELIKITKEHL